MNFEVERLNTEQAAQYLGISKATLETWRSTKTIRVPFYRVGDRVFYTRVDLNEFLKRARVEPAA